MAITAAGLKSLRDHVLTWKYIAVIDDASAELMRIEIGDDARATVVSNGDTNPVTVQVVVSGDDAEITVGDIVEGVALFAADTGGDALVSETVTSFEFESTDDELTINVTVEIPEIVE